MSARLCLLMLLVLAHKGTGLRCWTCSTRTEGGCADPLSLDRGSLMLCPTAKFFRLDPVCVKQAISVDGEMMVNRGCFLVNQNQPGDTPCNKRVNEEFCDLCDNKDGCNGVSRLALVPSVLLLGLVVVLRLL